MTRRERVTAAFHRSTPWQKTISMVAGLTTIAVFVGILAGCARWINQTAGNLATKTGVDSMYVRNSTFTVFQAGLETQHMRDSLIADARASRSEAALNLLVADCRKRGGCP